MTTVVTPPKLHAPKVVLDIKPVPSWDVLISHGGKYCESLVAGALYNIFRLGEPDVIRLLSLISASRAEHPVKVSLTRDLAETYAFRANEYCKEEQEGCDCGSNVLFTARQAA